MLHARSFPLARRLAAAGCSDPRVARTPCSACRSSFFDKSAKVYGVPVDIPGPGVTYRNRRYLSLLETPYEGGNTVPALFNISAQRHKSLPLLGTRPLIAREEEFNAQAGRSFEKLTLGDYEWQTYGVAHERALAVGSGLVGLGHKKGEMLAIFAETRADWFVSLQVCEKGISPALLHGYSARNHCFPCRKAGARRLEASFIGRYFRGKKLQ